MKPIHKLLSLVPVLVAPLVWAQPSPPITFTVRSYQSFTDGFTKIVDTVSPGSAAEALGELREGLGIQDLKGIDKGRPWQVAVWAEGLSTPPCVSIRVPVSDFAAFRDGLNPGLLQGDGNRIQEIGNYATVWLEFGPPSAATTEGEKAWKPDSLKTPAGLAQLVVRPGTALREELVGAVGMGRMAIGAAMANQDAQAMGGIDPKAMGELMSVYFDLIETGLKGLESLDVGVDLKNDKLTLDETIAPVAGSTLAGWLKTKEGNLGALASYLDANAPMALAMRFEENEGLMPTLKRLISLSMQMQGLPADSDAVRETEQLLEEFVPMHFAGNFDLKQGIQFGGVYRFPGKNPAEVYGTMKKFLQNSMQSQVGADKPYSSITVEEGQRKVGNVAVDRTTMVINLDAPMYQMPGQKEMMEAMMPGGKMVFDYALKGEDLFMGSPARLDAILAGPSGTAYRPEGVSPRTVAYGYFNVFSLIPAIMAANPGISDDDKEKLATIDATGTAIDFRVDMGNTLHYQAGIPLKFFKTIGQIAD